MSTLFGTGLHTINVGLDRFAGTIAAAGGKVTGVDWSPPAEGDAAIGRLLAGMIARDDIEDANRTAYARYLAADPVVETVAPAGEAIPGIGARTILHAGPPIGWADMCGPMQGAIVGAILYEGWESDGDAATALAASGEITFAPCHHHSAVGPMAGIVSPSMPVWVVAERTGGGHAFCSLNEGLGRVLRFGANDAEVLTRLGWMKDELAPVLAGALAGMGGIELKPIMAQALHMGDEVHNRNAAASSLLLKRLVPALLAGEADRAAVARVVEFMAGNDHFFLNLSMAACKAMLDAAHGIPGSSMVTAMARNGVCFGIRVSGTGDRWFTAPAPVIEGLFFPGYGIADANPDLGDSTITESAGLGGFAMAAAPAIVQFVGGAPADAIANSVEMGHITLGRNDAFTLPALNFAGTPAGIDIRAVADSGIAPVINTGIAHRAAGVGQVGAGITRAPLSCFSQAVAALAKTLDI